MTYESVNNTDNMGSDNIDNQIKMMNGLNDLI